MYPPMLYHTNPILATHNTISHNIYNVKDTVSTESDMVQDLTAKSSSKPCVSPSSSSTSSSGSYLSTSPVSPTPIYHHNTDIHPAFPYINSVQSPSIDPHALAAYYKGILQNPSSNQNVMFVPPAMFPVPSAAHNDRRMSCSRNSQSAEDNIDIEKLNES